LRSRRAAVHREPRVGDAARTRHRHRGAEPVLGNSKARSTGRVSPAMVKESRRRLVDRRPSERRRCSSRRDAKASPQDARRVSASERTQISASRTLEERDARDAVGPSTRQSRTPRSAFRRSRSARMLVAYEPCGDRDGRPYPPAGLPGSARPHRNRLRQCSAGDAAVRCRILYGGSVSPYISMRSSPIYDVDGALVGGKPRGADLRRIVNAERAACCIIGGFLRQM